MSEDKEYMNLQTLLAKALAGVEAEEFRNIISKSIEQSIANYDMQRLISIAVEPVARELIKEHLKDPAVLSVLHEKTRAAVLAADVKVQERRGGYS